MLRRCRFVGGRAALVVAVGMAIAVCAQNQPPTKQARVIALLVGVSAYDEPGFRDLQGPANDLPLLADTLKERFGLREADLRLLSEAEAAKDRSRRPTLANIRRELGALAANAYQPGDQVLIYFSGHGVQQLANKNDDLEVDGLDEVFLPADATRNPAGTVLTNALTDDELRKALHAITAKGAMLWLIADCCHSGTIARGRLGDVPRHHSPTEIFSPAVAAEIIKRQSAPAATASPRNGPDGAGMPQNAVALYAARSHETTVEREFPDATGDGKPDTFGLLTYNLVKVLRSQPINVPLTYRQLLQRIQGEHNAIHYEQYPVPLVEGSGSGRQVLGMQIQPPTHDWTLDREGDEFQVQAGMLHGVTAGSILAVYPKEDESGTKPRLGHVKVITAGAIRSDVAPCAFNDEMQNWPVLDDLPAGGRCELVYFDYGDLRLKVATRVTAGSQPEASAEAALQSGLQAVAKLPEVPLTIVDNPQEANWCLETDGSRAYLTPAQGLAFQAGQEPAFTTIKLGELPKELPDQLRRIARAELLRQIATTNPYPSRGSSQVDIAVELLKYRNAADQQGTAIDALQQRPRLQAPKDEKDRDIVAVRVSNRSKDTKLYVTLLLVDSGCGIQAIYPEEGDVCEQLMPGASFITARWRVDPKTLGTESIIALAVKSSGRPADFTSVLQPTLAQARDAYKERGPREEGTQLGNLLLDTLFAGTNPSRGLPLVEADRCATSILTWETVAPSR